MMKNKAIDIKIIFKNIMNKLKIFQVKIITEQS